MSFDSEADQNPPATKIASSRRQGAPTTGGIQLGAGPLTVHLAPAHESAPSFADQIEALGEDQRLYLVISNFKAQTQPGVVYRVYLDLPTGPSDANREGQFIGTMTFFDATAHSGHSFASLPGRTRRFDVTDVVRRLHAQGRTGTTPSVTIAPVGEPAANARPVIGEISLVGQH